VLNGESALQVTPGAGDLSQGNIGAVVLNLDSKCAPSPGVTYYTVAVPGIGPQVVPLSSNLGPAPVGSSSHSICTAADSTVYNATHGTTGGDAYRVYAAAFDYPVFRARVITPIRT
jgi:hypothetical protein